MKKDNIYDSYFLEVSEKEKNGKFYNQVSHLRCALKK